MRIGHFKENNASKRVIRPRSKISRPKILVLHIFKSVKSFRDQAKIKNNHWHRLLQVFYFYSIPKQIGVKCTLSVNKRTQNDWL